MHQCPGCLEYIDIRIDKATAPPVPYEVDEYGESKKHRCKKLIQLRKEIEDTPVSTDDDESLFGGDSDDQWEQECLDHGD